MNNASLPDWAHQTIVSAGIDFDIAGFKQEIWNDFLRTNSTLKPESHERFFHLHLAMRIKTGWVDEMCQSIKQIQSLPVIQYDEFECQRELKSPYTDKELSCLVEVPMEIINEIEAIIELYRSSDWADEDRKVKLLFNLAQARKSI